MAEPVRISATLERRDDSQLFFRCADGSEAVLPAAVAPDLRQGDTVALCVAAPNDLRTEEEFRAREILNTILSTNLA